MNTGSGDSSVGKGTNVQKKPINGRVETTISAFLATKETSIIPMTGKVPVVRMEVVMKRPEPVLKRVDAYDVHWDSDCLELNSEAP